MSVDAVVLYKMMRKNTMIDYWVTLGIGVSANTPEEAAQAAWDEIEQHYMDITDEKTGDFEQVAVSDVVKENT